MEEQFWIQCSVEQLKRVSHSVNVRAENQRENIYFQIGIHKEGIQGVAEKKILKQCSKQHMG